jgi:hypothetical protein
MTRSIHSCTECGRLSNQSAVKQTGQWCRRCGSQLSGEAEDAAAAGHRWHKSSLGATKRQRVIAIWADVLGLLALAGLALAF